jgi:hypothetical protein
MCTVHSEQEVVCGHYCAQDCSAAHPTPLGVWGCAVRQGAVTRGANVRLHGIPAWFKRVLPGDEKEGGRGGTYNPLLHTSITCHIASGVLPKQLCYGAQNVISPR